MRVMVALALSFVFAGTATAVPLPTESSIKVDELSAATKGIKVGEVTLKNGKKVTIACAVKDKVKLSCAGFFGSDGGLADVVKLTEIGADFIALDAGDGVSFRVKLQGKHAFQKAARTYIEEVWTDMRPKPTTRTK